MKPAHNLRGDDGRYVATLLCDACNKPAGTEPMCDDEVTHGDQIPGFILCYRKRCTGRLRGLDADARRAHYEATVAARGAQ